MSDDMSANAAERTARVHIEYPAAGVGRIWLARPEARNAQDKQLLYELNDAFDELMANDSVAVVILAAEGPHFSSGHDLRDRTKLAEFDTVSAWGGFTLPGAEGYYAYEQELYVGLCRRWRNLMKPTIAQVQGKVIAGGLMLVWVCDLIVAASDATFSDPVVAFGVNGHEFFVHPWEVGARRAKEMLFTGEPIGAADARALGMVNHVVEPAELDTFTVDLAARIATRPTFGLKLAKQAVNQTLDIQGQSAAIEAAFSLHQLGHSHNRHVFGKLAHPDGVEIIRNQASRT